MAVPNLSEIITTTLRNRRGKARDNLSNNTALFNRLSAKGKIRLVGGGRTLVEEIINAENASFGWYDDYEVVSTVRNDVISAAEFDWKQASVAVQISGKEKRMNSGKEELINLLETRINVAEKTMNNKLSTACYSDGTASGGKQIGGLALLVADTPTSGTVGGIDRSLWTFWRNVSKQSSADFAGAATSSTIQSHMNRVYFPLTRGKDKPDLLVGGDTAYRLYLESLQAIQRITNDSLGQAGYDNLKYMSADFALDGGYNGGCPTNSIYFLNTDYIGLTAHKDCFMDPLEPETRASVNQDVIVKLVGFMGNMTISNCFLQGVLRVN